ncbi:MAG TPA: PIG-L deacetylase family protein [Dermatophilaceae bacterium]|nr:PIG-L deacetylase family protein [Dermatophilaceae bacterium]
MKATFGDAFLKEQRLLVVAPHPDDEVLGCAGTMARVKALGGEVFVLMLTAGGIEQYGRGLDGGTALVPGSTRVQEFEAVMKYLDVDGSDVLFTDDETHQRLDTRPQREIIEWLERGSLLSLEALRPSMVLIPALSFNQDHRAAHRACVAATRPAAPGTRHFAPTVLTYDNSTGFWSPPDEAFTPDVYVDISDFLEIKMTALDLYRSQMRPPPFHASPEGIRTEAIYRGGQVALHAAEAFRTMRLVL